MVARSNFEVGVHTSRHLSRLDRGTGSRRRGGVGFRNSQSSNLCGLRGHFTWGGESADPKEFFQK